ncbi:MAG: TetR/AcrR family transcriptional regulator [Gammaproteobacteria bacterium]|nr:TetR/AcrR family transcriptional regulator [Gammaproteobacteria bacterium]
MTSAKRRPPRRSAHIEQEASILALAREELTRCGYDGVTMQALADRAGVVKKTLYNRYGSKDGLLLTAVAEILDSYRGRAAQIEPGIPAIIAVRRGGNRQLVATPEYAEAMTRALMQADADHPLVDLLLGQAMTSQVRHLEIAAGQDELRPGIEPRALAEQLTGHSWGLILLWVKGLLPLATFEQQSLTGMLTLLVAVTQGPRHDALAAMLAAAHPHRSGDSPTAGSPRNTSGEAHAASLTPSLIGGQTS